tara:strand:+ start:579 stop:2846 length:2268 start_codon:yes stop_codon:yes gene_type:complete
MNDVVIRILDTSNTVLGDLDLTNFTDFPLVLTKGIVNLDNLKARTGTFSKTFKVPNTKNNANLLSNVDNINSRKDYRDALNRKPCVIIVSGTQIDKGFIQVGKVFDGFELDSYELVFFGNNIDWVKSASELKLRNINYRNNNQFYRTDIINTVNSSNSDVYDNCYPYISKGGNEDIAGLNAQVRDFYPSFYLRSIIERGLNDLGWNVSSSFLDLNSSISNPVSTHVKRLACDLSPSFTVAEDVVKDSVSRAELTTNVEVGYLDTDIIIFDNDSTPPNEDVNGNYDNGTGQYSLPADGTYNVDVSLEFGNWVAITGLYVNVTVSLYIAGTEVDSISRRLYKLRNETITGTLRTNGLLNSNATVRVSFVSDGGVSGIEAKGHVLLGSYIRVQRQSEIVEGNSFNLNEIIPSSPTLLDVINDFTRMFNIYYWTDVKTKTIYLEPRDTFFESKTSALDWTNKLDVGKGYEVDYISSYKRNVEFKYKDLNNDEWLKGWQDLNKRIYARYNHVLPERFAEGSNTVELGLFSAVYSHDCVEVSPVNANLVFTSLKVWNEYINPESAPSERITNYNPKIFLFNNGTQLNVSGGNRQIKKFGRLETTIPYGIFETYNNTTSDINLSFTGDDGLFSTYYSNMFKNIEEGGRLIAYLNLTSTDVDNLDFRKLVYIDRPSKLNGYYLIEQLIDYNPLSDGLTKVSLFKFENLGSVAIDGTQQGNNSNNDDNGNTPAPLQPIYVEDGSNLIEVYIENPLTGLIEPVYR